MSNYGSQNRLYHGQSSASKGDLIGNYARSEVVHSGGNGYDPYQEGYNTYTFSKSSGGGMPSGAMMSGGTMSNGMVIKGGHTSTMMSSSGGGMSGGMGGGMGGGMASGVASGMSMSGGMGGGMGGGMASGMASGMAMSGGMGGGMASGMAMSGGMGGGMGGGSSSIHQRAVLLQNQCQEYLKKAEYALQSGGSTADVEHYMMLAKESIVHMRSCAMDLRQLGQPNDNVVRTLEVCKDQLKVVQMAMTGSLHRRRSTRVSSGGWEEPGRSFQDAIAWIAQRKRLIETAPWGDDPASIEQQVLSHQSFHSAHQRSAEVARAREDLMKNGDKGNLHALDQEWESLQQMSIGRTEQLQELKKIIQDISREIMWVNEREEEELMFDWGDKNIDKYIPKKQEGYSKLMSALEEKEKDLNKLKGKVDTLLKNNHPASDKIEAYSDTLQTQWSWLLQITKCIDTHLKENGAYNQFFKEANETYSNLQKEHETVRKKFICDKNTPLEGLGEMLNGLEREKEIIMENKRQVQHLVHKSRNIVRLKPRNAEDKSNSQVIVKALCDFKREQKVICKGDEAILNNNSQRSKWDITGPGGLDMSVPSVCLMYPPQPTRHQNEQYYDAIMSIWNQLYINVKSLISWQYCLIDIRQINSLTMTMLSRMPPEEYRQLIKRMETHFEEFKSCSYGSEMFTDDDKRGIDNQFTGAQTHYEELVVQLPAYNDGIRDCGLKISQLETVQQDVHLMNEDYVRLREQILKELEGMKDPDKAQFLRSEIEIINQRLGSLESSSSAYLQRLQALRDMLESVARAEDIVKVHEARLTEKETTSLTPSEVEDYMSTLKNIKAELDQKKSVLASMEAELSQANHWNGQVGVPFYRCDMMLSKYSEQVGLLTDRWKRIQAQIDTRVQDLQVYHPQLEHYKQTSTSIIDWIDTTRKKQDSLQATKIESIPALTEHITKQKALNSEIKAKRETVERVLRDNEACVNSIKDYETDLAAYSSGLETLLDIPVKRTMLKSPTMDLNVEATQLQTRYMELLAHSGDYSKFLGVLQKNMEELKIRNTRIDLLEEELRQLRENMQDSHAKNKSLEDAVTRYQLELSNSKDQLLSLEEVKQITTQQCNSTKDSLDGYQSQMSDLNDQVTRLQYMLDEEKRKKKLAEERYTTQQEEYELVLRKRQKELETISWSKVELEKNVSTKEHEIEQLRRQLAEEAARIKELQREMSKTKVTMQTIESQYSEIEIERDNLLRKVQSSDKDRDSCRILEEELRLIKSSKDSELRRLQEDNERVKKDLNYWKDQYESKQDMIRQYDTENNRMESEKKSLKSEIDRLMRELKELDEKYKSRLSDMEKERRDVVIVRKNMETQLTKVRETPAVDPSSLVFDGVRKPVTADQLLDCAVLDQPTFSQLVKGQKTVPGVSDDKKVNLKGTGPIAGVVVEGPKGPGSIIGPLYKMTLTEAKKENLLPPDCVYLLLDAQAATGHIIDPRTNQKFTVEEACAQGVVDEEERERLLAAEGAAVGYRGPGTSKPLSVFQAMKKGLIDKNTTLRLLQAQESVGGILDPVLSVFLPKDKAIERNLINDDIKRALNQEPELYMDPESEDGVTYMSMKKRCKVELHTGLLLLPVPEKVDHSKLTFDGVRKPVTAKQLLDCGVLDKPTFKDLEKGKKTVPEVSDDKKVSLKGTGPIAGVVAGTRGKISFTEAKKQMLISEDSADLLLEAQAATGHIIDPKTNQKLTVEEACARGVGEKTVPEVSLDKKVFLKGTGSIAGVAAGPMGKMSLSEAKKQMLMPSESADLLLDAQAATGHIIDPLTNQKLTVEEACAQRVVDIGDRDNS
ncbi:hypothetical protein F7725_028074 [Dissostichus mawsoni]|uniref:Desmoplakin n=1 Tax=Dissostichus mawsoni TaxID=36200 RepID=A0A7J5XEN2_DISMA|nr:hypothetical protein F7725_028074 [Dissostichus mawsoni]